MWLQLVGWAEFPHQYVENKHISLRQCEIVRGGIYAKVLLKWAVRVRCFLALVQLC